MQEVIETLRCIRELVDMGSARLTDIDNPDYVEALDKAVVYIEKKLEEDKI